MSNDPEAERFADRDDAGRKLAEAITEEGIAADIVLAIPRGGLPIGRAVADALDLPLDIITAKKIGAPGNPELALGAVASDGTVYRDDRMLEHVGPHETYLERQEREQQEAAAEKLRTYRGEDRPPDVGGRTVLLVDDGVATGSTAIACIRQLHSSVRNVSSSRSRSVRPVPSTGSMRRWTMSSVSMPRTISWPSAATTGRSSRSVMLRPRSICMTDERASPTGPDPGTSKEDAPCGVPDRERPDKHRDCKERCADRPETAPRFLQGYQTP